MDNTESAKQAENKTNEQPLRESSGVHYMTMVKITDPNTGETLLKIRGDE
jgi:hypothetical protein